MNNPATGAYAGHYPGERTEDRLRARVDRPQDLTAQRDALQALGVEAQRIYVDHGLTGTNRDRPGLREALAACRAGDRHPGRDQTQEAHLVEMHRAGEHGPAELAELFRVGRSTVYRAIERARTRIDAGAELVAEPVRARQRP